MSCYHNNPALKTKYVKRMKAHILADELIRGEGWDNGKGCAVGCTFNYYNHVKGAAESGIPEWALRLIDRLHEGVSRDYQYKGEPVALAFLRSIKSGSDLTKAEHLIHIFIQKMNLKRVAKLSIDADIKAQIMDAINGVIDVRQKSLDFGGYDLPAYWAAYSAADSAAKSAYLATDSASLAAYWATDSAADSAAHSAGSAYWAAYSAYSATDSAAKSAYWATDSASLAAYDTIADAFLKILGEQT